MNNKNDRVEYVLNPMFDEITSSVMLDDDEPKSTEEIQQQKRKHYAEKMNSSRENMIPTTFGQQQLRSTA